MDALAPVEVDIETGVDDVEATDPEGDHAHKQEWLPGPYPGDSDPGAHRRQADRGSQEDVAERGEALGIGIDDEGCYDNGGKVPCQWWQLVQADRKCRQRDAAESDPLGER